MCCIKLNTNNGVSNTEDGVSYEADEMKNVTNYTIDDFFKQDSAPAIKVTQAAKQVPPNNCDDSTPAIEVTQAANDRGRRKANGGRRKASDRVTQASHLGRVEAEYRTATATKGKSTLCMEEENYKNNCITSRDECASDSQSVKRKSEAYYSNKAKRKRRSSDVHTSGNCSRCHGSDKGRSRKLHDHEMTWLGYLSESSNGSTAGVPRAGLVYEPMKSGTY